MLNKIKFCFGFVSTSQFECLFNNSHCFSESECVYLMLSIIPDLEDLPMNKTRKIYSLSFIWVLFKDLQCTDTLLDT